MDNLPHLIWLRSFEAAARLNSFSAAAKELHLTPAAVSQQMGLLEKHLGAALFRRLARGVVLTDVGQSYAEHVRDSLIDISDATRGLFGSKKQSVLNVRASVSFAALVLAPKLNEFHTLYPDIQVQLSTTVWADHFEEDSLDVDIRYGYGNWAESGIIHLGDDTAQIVCHPDYAASFGDELTVQNVARAEVVQTVGTEISWLKMSAAYGLNLQVSENWIKVDSSHIALQIVSAGRGATIVLSQYAQWYIDNGLLTSPFDYRLRGRPSLYAVPRPGTKKTEEVRLFCQWMKSLGSRENE